MQYKWVVLSVTTIGLLMAQIDNRIVVVGLPTIGRELGIGLSELIWVTQVYVVVSTISALLLGRVSDIVGRVRLFTIGFAVFTIGSALASLAFTGEELIAARALQGVGGALLTSNAAAMLTDAAEGKGLGTLLGINSVVANIGAITGLTLSGLILAVTDWRALFYVNIPFGIFGTWWARRALHEINTKDTHRKMDWGGFLSFVSSLSLILLSLTILSYGLADEAFGLLLLGSGFVLLAAFVWFERRAEAPILNLSLFKIRPFAMGNLALFLNALPWFGLTILVSFYLQLGLGLSPLRTGLDFLPIQGAFIIIGPLMGKISDKYGHRRYLAATGIAIFSVGYLLFAIIAPNANEAQLVATLTLLGVGAGFFITPNTTDVMSSVPPERRGVASGFRSTMAGSANSASYGLVILILTFTIPYGDLTTLLQGTATATDSLLRSELLHGTQIAAFILVALNTLALIPQLLAKPASGKVKGPSANIANVE